ncbi:MAG: hypothetical protein IPH16_13910 [Haliscomenobacter sp.]|nr:hypothetical protein [Haliscomenobacter sp.]
MIIEKGSVIAIQHGQPLDTKIFAGGIGSHKAEGFGQVMINPSFLLSTGIKLSLVLTKVKKQIEALAPAEVGVPSAQDTFLLNYLEQQKTQKSGIFSLSERVNEFVSKHGRDFQGISPSQWGTIRAYAKHAANWDVLKKLLFNKDIGALYRGQSESDWRQNGRREKLSDFLATIKDTDRLAFTLKLAAEMAKRKQSKEPA